MVGSGLAVENVLVRRIEEGDVRKSGSVNKHRKSENSKAIARKSQ